MVAVRLLIALISPTMPRTISHTPSAPIATASTSPRIRRKRTLTRWAPAPRSTIAESINETPTRSASTVTTASPRPPSSIALATTAAPVVARKT